VGISRKKKAAIVLSSLLALGVLSETQGRFKGLIRQNIHYYFTEPPQKTTFKASTEKNESALIRIMQSEPSGKTIPWDGKENIRRSIFLVLIPEGQKGSYEETLKISAGYQNIKDVRVTAVLGEEFPTIEYQAVNLYSRDKEWQPHKIDSNKIDFLRSYKLKNNQSFAGAIGN